ncbi:secreted RxLR effector protein 161-like [Bidens hawaiensis]|uniref:secreted RxLR effector protein 161-like n=1 Tax=Bidens hawaiensis TaxID=980011 RepID=UPI00404B0393
MSTCNTEETPMNTYEKLSMDDHADIVNETTYRSLVGGLIYLTHTRVDLSYSVSVVARYTQSPSKDYLGAARRILRYVSGTLSYGLWYEKGAKIELIGYTDSDWASVSANVFMIGSGAISWSSKKQSTVALCSIEAKYIALPLLHVKLYG